MNTCILCSKQFYPQQGDSSNSLLRCNICKIGCEALYKRHLGKSMDTSDVCWSCDTEILEEHNQLHLPVDIK